MKKQSNILKAFRFAEEKHKNQFRKGNYLPYMTHIYDVARILLNNNCEPEVVVAGILHDTLEDTQTTKEEILFLFGNSVLEIVLDETENKALCWKERKQDRISQMKTASFSTKKVKCADMLANLTDLKRDLQSKGEIIWQKFNADKADITWYYKSMIQNMQELENLQMYEALKKVFASVFEKNQTLNIVNN